MNNGIKIINKVLLCFVILYPLLPSYGNTSANLIIYLLTLLFISSIIIERNFRNFFICTLKNIKKDFLLISLLLLNLSMYVSYFIATNKKIVFTNSIRFSMYIFIFYLITYTIINKKVFNNYINIFIITSTIINVITLLQIIYIYIIGTGIDEQHRIASTLENTNNLGAYTILAFFVTIGYFIKNRNKKIKLTLIIVMILQLISIIACQSRNALIGIVIGSIIIAILYDRRYLLFTFILSILLMIIPQSRVRVLEILDINQNSSRLKLWETTLHMIRDNPILGIGYENYSIIYNSYINKYPDLINWYGYQPFHPHNIILKIQSELGVLGSISFLIFIISIFYLFYKLIKKNKSNRNKVLFIGIFSSILAFSSMNLIDCFFGSPKIILTLLILLAFCNGYYQISKTS